MAQNGLFQVNTTKSPVMIVNRIDLPGIFFSTFIWSWVDEYKYQSYNSRPRNQPSNPRRLPVFNKNLVTFKIDLGTRSISMIYFLSLYQTDLKKRGDSTGIREPFLLVLSHCSLIPSFTNRNHHTNRVQYHVSISITFTDLKAVSNRC